MAASEILRRNPAARIVFATVHDEAEMVKKSLAIARMKKLKLSDPITQKLDFSLSTERQPDAADTRWNTNRR